MSKRAIIFAAGKYTNDDISLYKRIKFKEDDLLICADGGYNLAVAAKVEPHVVIGDMDSIKSKVDKSVKVFTYPCKKDKTDMHICVDYAISKGCDQILLLGALGGRIDHQIGVFMILLYIQSKGLDGMILSADSRVYIVNKSITINRETFSRISLIPATEVAESVTTKGLKYELNNCDLNRMDSRGISNEFLDDVTEISVKKGILYVVCEEFAEL